MIGAIGLTARIVLMGAFAGLFAQQVWLHAAPPPGRDHDLPQVLANHLGESLLYDLTQTAADGSVRMLGDVRLTFLPDDERYRVALDLHTESLGSLPGAELLSLRLGEALSADSGTGLARVHVEATFDARARWLTLDASGSAVGAALSTTLRQLDGRLSGVWRVAEDGERHLNQVEARPLSVAVAPDLAARVICALTLPAGLRPGDRWGISMPSVPGVGARALTATALANEALTLGGTRYDHALRIELTDGATPAATLWCDARGTVLCLRESELRARDAGGAFVLSLRQRLGGNVPADGGAP